MITDEVAGWSSMQSAPRDGSVILLRWGEDLISPAWWTGDIPSDPAVPSAEFLWAFIDAESSEFRRYFINHDADNEYGPSHWAPYAPFQSSVAPLLQSPDVAPMLVPNWQPIETAPKDGRYLIVRYIDETGLEQVCKAAFLDCVWASYDTACAIEPNHWTPLLKLPQ